MRKFAAFLVYLLAFAVIIAMGGLFLGYWVSNSEENLSYVYVGDINVSGKTRDEIAVILGIRSETVKTHLRHIMEKLDTVNTVASVARGFELGLLRA